MTTDLERAATAHRPPTLAQPRRSSRSSHPRIVIIEDNPEMSALLGEILADDFEIAVPPVPVTIATLDVEGPDVILIGTAERRSQTQLTAGEIASLVARHMRLHTVPIVVLTPNPRVLGDARDLPDLAGVTLLSLPFDIETIRCVLKSIARQASRARWSI